MNQETRRRTVIGAELLTAGCAALGGALLVAAPDGSLLHADPAVLAGSPFTDWRVPGMLLLTLVTGGYAAAAGELWRKGPFARELSLVAGGGLVCFEAAELGWLGFQPLEAVMAGVGAAVAVLAAGLPHGHRRVAGVR